MTTTQTKQYKRYTVAFGFFIVVFLAAAPSYSQQTVTFFPKGSYRFEERKGKDTVRIQWEYAPDSNQQLTVYRPMETFVFKHDLSYATSYIHYKTITKKSDFTAIRVKKNIEFDGIFKGSPKQEKIDIDNLPWMQSIPFSLGRRVVHFAADSEAVFWVFRPDNLSVIKLKAEFDSYDTITVANKTTPAIRVIVHPTGLWSAFWHGTYWFRRDGLFLLYRGVNGVPGTAETVIEYTGSE